ncbi:MAG: M13 family metallopeptidase [Prevotella sp.]|nr:M13 family metallopeptidase [Prevotella sp.]
MKKIFIMTAFAMLASASMAQTLLKSGIDLTDLNQTVKPGDNFYEYACGGWMKKHPLPAAYSRYGSFDRLAEDNNKRINSILGELQKGSYAKGTVEQKLSDFYKLAMDSTRRNKEGVKPVLPLIKEIEAAPTVEALREIQNKYAALGIGVPMGIGFGADEKNASQNILNVYQGGLTLGQKEYYLDSDKPTAEIREAYKKHIVRMFQLFGFKKKEAQKKMDLILDYETQLAQVSKSRTEMRDVEANYNKVTFETFKALYPNIPLEKFLNAEGVATKYFQEMIIGQPDFLAGADKLIGKHTADQLRAYMEWDVITGSASYLSDDIVEANFDFFGKTMSGRKENFPRWKRATNQVEAQMGEALGKMYVERFFPASSKERMERLVKNLQLSLAERIMAQDWMETDTKLNALSKLSTFYVKIGYPDKWKDMSGLTIDPSKSYYENVIACRMFWDKDEIERKAGKPVDNTEWYMTPQTVNAYYNPTTNEICFPAGILQVPFFDPTADDAFNYGAIGVVIGHEMTHGFDDQGRHYDKDGNMKDWWTEADGKGFEERTGKYADFFSNIKVLPDLNGNGRLTLGENLADHGGLQVAFNAFLNATKNSPLSTIDGLTPAQRFFLAYAGVWAGNITEKEIRSRTKSDPHSLGKWRVDGALPHINAWYEAFGVKPGDKMYIPENERLNLW